MKNYLTALLFLILFSLGLVAFGFWFLILASLAITLFILVACYLDVDTFDLDRKAHDDFFNNPFRQDLSQRTFPQIIIPERPRANLTILHQPSGPLFV